MKAKILVVEDSHAQAEFISSILKRHGYEVIVANGGAEGLKMAKFGSPDLVILDVVMEDIDGLAVCRWLKLNEETRTIPVIMLTVKGEVADKVEGLHVGADDYLPKPFNEDELEARIYAALRNKGNLTELKKRNKEMEELLQRVESMAMTDPLTGLCNRRRFGDVLRREYATSRRYKNHLSMLMVDVDHFKKFNDGYGHQVGDSLLQELAHVLAGNLREVDVTSRYGGEEFAILLPHTDKASATLVADRMCALVRAKVFAVDGHNLHLTISIGVASNDDIEHANCEELVTYADRALYRAKEQGRDCAVAYQRGMMQAP